MWSKWIPVEEDLPDHDDEVLVAYEDYNRHMVTVARYTPLRIKGEIEYVWVEDIEIMSGTVTHWAPFPEHPVLEERRRKKQAQDWEKLEDYGYIDRDDFYD